MQCPVPGLCSLRCSDTSKKRNTYVEESWQLNPECVSLSTVPAHWVSVPPEVLSSPLSTVWTPLCTGDFSEPKLVLVPRVPTPAEEPLRADSEVVP